MSNKLIKLWKSEQDNLYEKIREGWLKLLDAEVDLTEDEIPEEVLQSAIKMSDEDIFLAWIDNADWQSPEEAVEQWFDVDELPSFIWRWLEASKKCIPQTLIDAARYSWNFDENTRKDIIRHNSVCVKQYGRKK